MTQLRKLPYWEKIVAHYYENIHWDRNEQATMYSWLEDEYHAKADRFADKIVFEDEKDATWFMLRWQDEDNIYH